MAKRNAVTNKRTVVKANIKKVASTKRAGTKPDWQIKWPRNDDLKSWMRCMIKKCYAITNNEEAVRKATLPIDQLAKLGEGGEALRHINRYLRRLPKGSGWTRCSLAELGAEVCLNAEDRQGIEKYLVIAEASESEGSNFCHKSVRKFRAMHGILDPADALDEEERIEAAFHLAKRQFRLAMADRKKKVAVAYIKEMEQEAKKSKERLFRQFRMWDVLGAYVELKDASAVKRCISRMSKSERDEALDAETLATLGMKDEAIVRAKKTIRDELATLREDDDPNIHFPVMSICKMLKLLAGQGENKEAGKILRKVFREMPEWPVYELGWVTSAVYTQLAEVAAVLEGSESAKRLLDRAMADAMREKRKGFAGGAITSAVIARANVGAMDEAIAKARKIRSPTLRRQDLAILLTRARRFKELREVLTGAASPEEAASLCWIVKFELPGGAPE